MHVLNVSGESSAQTRFFLNFLVCYFDWLGQGAIGSEADWFESCMIEKYLALANRIGSDKDASGIFIYSRVFIIRVRMMMQTAP